MPVSSGLDFFIPKAIAILISHRTLSVVFSDNTVDYLLLGREAASSSNPIYNLIKDLSDKDKIFIEDFIELYIKKDKAL